MVEVKPLNARKTFRQWTTIPIGVGLVAAIVFGILMVMFTYAEMWTVLKIFTWTSLLVALICVWLCFKGMPAFRMFCNHCDKLVASNIQWRCGYCDAENTVTEWYSFMRYCETCKRAPKSFLCSHCGKLIFLDEDNDSSHPAMKISPSVPGETLEQIHIRRAEDIAQRQHAITITRLDALLASEQAKAKPPPEKKSKREILEEDFKEFHTEVMGVKGIAQRELDLAEKNYTDNPRRLEEERATITQWRKEHLPE